MRIWLIVWLLFSVLVSLLGLLWFLQGTGLLIIPPILCVSNCKPLTGPSLTWGIIGFITMLAGDVSLLLALRARKARRQQ